MGFVNGIVPRNGHQSYGLDPSIPQARVIALQRHYQRTSALAISQQMRRVDWVTTGGEIGALLLEAALNEH